MIRKMSGSEQKRKKRISTRTLLQKSKKAGPPPKREPPDRESRSGHSIFTGSPWSWRTLVSESVLKWKSFSAMMAAHDHDEGVMCKKVSFDTDSVRLGINAGALLA